MRKLNQIKFAGNEKCCRRRNEESGSSLRMDFMKNFNFKLSSEILIFFGNRMAIFEIIHFIEVNSFLRYRPGA